VTGIRSVSDGQTQPFLDRSASRTQRREDPGKQEGDPGKDEALTQELETLDPRTLRNGARGIGGDVAGGDQGEDEPAE